MPLVASLLLVAMPGAPSSFLLFVDSGASCGIQHLPTIGSHGATATSLKGLFGASGLGLQELKMVLFFWGEGSGCTVHGCGHALFALSTSSIGGSSNEKDPEKEYPMTPKS